MKTPAEQLAQATKGMETVEASRIDRVVANGVELTATISMAISLKRIADAMTTGTKNDRVPATTVARASFTIMRQVEVDINGKPVKAIQ